MKRSTKLLVGLFLSSLFLSGTFYLTGDWKQLQPYLLVGGILGLFVLGFTFNTRVVINSKLLCVSLLFLASSLLSSLVHADLDLLLGALALFMIYLALVVVFPSLIKGDIVAGNKLIVYSYLLTHLPLIVVPLLIDSGVTLPYRGIFHNPNSFGSTAATLFAVVGAEFSCLVEERIFHLRKSFNRKTVLLVPILLFFLTLIMISRCRAGFATAALLVITNGVVLFGKSVLKGKIQLQAVKKILLFIFLLSVSGLGIYFCTSLGVLFRATILGKFINTSEDLLNGRLYVWLEVLGEARFWGYGRGYFNTFGMGAHNTYLSLLGQYGVLPTVSFALFLLLALDYSLRYVFRAIEDRYRYLLLYLWSSFVFLSLVEGMMFNTGMLLFYAALGLGSYRRTTVDSG